MEREKQIEEMAQDIWDALPDYEHNFRDCRDAAKEMIEKDYRKERQGEWISVEDRLPSNNNIVLCAVKTDISTHKKLYIGFYAGDYWYSSVEYFDENWCKRLDVTHWMPLPTPPKMKGAE